MYFSPQVRSCFRDTTICHMLEITLKSLSNPLRRIESCGVGEMIVELVDT